VASHDGPDCRGVWWRSGRGVEDLRDFTEKIRSEKTRRDDGKRPCFIWVEIVKPVNRSAWDAKRIAWPNFCLLSLHNQRQNTSQSVDRLFVTIVTVCDRHLGSSCNIEFEDCDEASGCLFLNEKSNGQPANPHFLLQT
jgi:hypothetical protein